MLTLGEQVDIVWPATSTGRADRGLYRAKHLGRNRVRVEGEPD